MSAPLSAFVAAVGLLVGAPAAAGERTASERLIPAAQPGGDRPAVVLATTAAVELPQGLSPQPAAAPVVKRRAARVTSCRCGDGAAPAAPETPQR